ncbi:MAG: hypothetical protein HRU07_00805 [Nitrosopumilus sp.]|nr:hypothetical protein [Nitrosopumilus sp.]NRA04716.1 hypothetical protein [Nitrosopumilus sp.]
MNNFITVFVITAIMVSGLLLGSMGTSVFADVANDNPGQARGCDNANANGKDKVKDKNPHCDSEPCDLIIWYFDNDGDGLGDPSGPQQSACDQPTGSWVSNNNDCDDDDILIGQTCPE